MISVPADTHRDRETMEQLQSIAIEIFTRYGIDLSIATCGGGWSNATWLAGGLVLRMAVEKGSNRLRREAALGALLPAEVGFPASLDTGEINGYEWSLSREITGKNLGELWPSLEWVQRIAAIRQLWKKVAAVHTVSPAAAAPYVIKRSLFYPADAAEARAGLARIFEQKWVSAPQTEFLGNIIERFWSAWDNAPRVLNHGDFTTQKPAPRLRSDAGNLGDRKRAGASR